MKTGGYPKSVGGFSRQTFFTPFQFILLSTVLLSMVLAGCATSSPDPFETRLAAMTDAELIAYSQGINERMKEIQSGTREEDRTGIVRQDDPLAQQTYFFGGEAWDLEKKRAKARKEMNRRGLSP
jgi:hypothetical protein